jgi:hypothetical protein
VASLPSWLLAKLGQKSLPGQLTPSKQSDDGRRKLVDANKRKRIVRNAINRPGCYDIN